MKSEIQNRRVPQKYVQIAHRVWLKCLERLQTVWSSRDSFSQIRGTTRASFQRNRIEVPPLGLPTFLDAKVAIDSEIDLDPPHIN